MRHLKSFVFVLVTLFSTVALAAEQKIAVVDLGAAIFSSEVAKARQNELRAESDFASLQAKYDSTTADIQALQKDAEANRMTWSEEQVESFQKKMEYLRADLELLQRKLQSEVRSLQNNIVNELRPKALEALQEIVKDEGITLLFRSDAVLVAQPDMDITAKLTDRLNKKTQ